MLSYKEGGEECLISKSPYFRDQQLIAIMRLLDEHHKKQLTTDKKLVRTGCIVVSSLPIKIKSKSDSFKGAMKKHQSSSYIMNSI